MNRTPVAIAVFAFARQLAAGAPADELSEILVTARHVPENAARVPLAINVVGRSYLGAGGVEDLQTLATSVPGLGFESLWGGISAAPVLRGQAQPSTAGDNVGVFVDEIYQASRSVIDVQMLDFDRIEVVRGPQNSLFGRSTFAGAIHYVSAQPTAERTGDVQVTVGGDGLAGLQAYWSGRLGESPWLGRVALGHSQMNGTLDSTQGESLGDSRRNSGVFTLAWQAADRSYSPFSLSLRVNHGAFGHPASSTLNATDYNCGARDSSSGLWTYFCGRAPIADRYSLTPAIPDSNARSEQTSLRIEQPLGQLSLRALTGYYHGKSIAYRDFDGSDAGLPSGVCTVNINCGTGSPATLTRFASPNVVSRPEQDATDWSQEIRLSRDTETGVSWMIGISGSWTRETNSSALGVDREDLQTDERLTALLASNPNRVGPQSLLNLALVQDSRNQQVLQTQSIDHRSAIAVFGMVDVPITTLSRARLELRGARETLKTESDYANFAPNPEPEPPGIDFSELTPRFALDFRPNANWYAYGSIARGARSGGINTTPGLTAEEREYGPEYNWTTELGLRHDADSFIESWQATFYRINWTDTQILGVANSPGVNSLVIGNTAGLTTRGIEAQVQLRLGSWWRSSVAFSQADPRFDNGSDDAGSRPFCGLTKQPPSSDFCAFGPPRTDSNGAIALVPYLDDNLAARTPRTTWAISVKSLPRAIAGGWRMSGDFSFSYQDNVFERPINGVSYGARALLGARLVLQRGDWRTELWGTNLTGDSYIRAASSRGGAFYPSLPRPLDFIYGEGRRVGLSVSRHFGSL